MLVLNRKALTMKMVFIIFMVVASVGVTVYAYEQALDSMFAKAVVETYGEAYKIVFHAGKSMGALPEDSAYTYETKYWDECKIRISTRFVKITREYGRRTIEAEVPLVVPLTWRSTGCQETALYANELCDTSKSDTIAGSLRYTDSIKFEDETIGKEYQEYSCGAKLRFEKITEAGDVVAGREYDKLWVREIEGDD